MTKLLRSTVGGLAATLLAADSGAVTVTRGPYLQLGTPGTALLRWSTDEPSGSLAVWGMEPGQAGAAVFEPERTTDHCVQLEQLIPNTEYFYSIGDSAGIFAGVVDSTRAFRTAPLPGVRDRVRVWVIGDSGTADSNARRVRDAYLNGIGALGTDVMLMLGDNAYGSGTDQQYQEAVFDMYAELLRCTFVWPTRGNHDDLRGGPGNDYYDFFSLPTNGEAGGIPSGTEAYYSFDWANVHFVCLDSHGTSRAPDGAMLTWLEQDLAANAREWTIAYWHHPPYTKGSHDSDDRGDSGGRLFDMRENVLPILEAYGVDLVLSGHSHSYERSFLLDGHYGTSSELESWMILDDGDGHPGGNGAYRTSTVAPRSHEGTVYAVVGSSGKVTGNGPLDHPVMATSIRDLGSLYLQIDGTRLDALFLDDDSQVRDFFRIDKDPATDAPENRDPFADFSLGAGEPNPFTNDTAFRFSLGREGPVRLSVFDVAGRRVATLVDGERSAGAHRVRWDGRTSRGDSVGAGVYFVVLELDGAIRTKKVVRTR